MQAEGGKGAANGRGIRRQTQECGTGHREERRGMAGGMCERRSGGCLSVPGKEVGSGCDREVLQRQPLLMGGGSREEIIKRSIKRQRQVGWGSRISCNH